MKTRSAIFATILFGLVTFVSADRENSVSATVDAVAAADNNPRVSGIRIDQGSDKYFPTWGLYPQIRLDSRGARSEFGVSYAFGLNQVENTDLDFDSESHSIGLNWTLKQERLSLTLSERFRKSPDFTTFNLFQGIVFTPEGVFFDYETIALRRDSYDNTASLTGDYRIGERSYLTFGGGHSLREFVDDPLFQKRLPNQQRFNADAGYRYQFGEHTSFDTGYRFDYYAYERGVYNDGINNDLYAGMQHSFTPTVSMSLSAGPSYTKQIDSNLDYWGYNARASVSKSFEKEFITFYYSHDNGSSVGLGSISKTHRVGFGFTQNFNQHISANFGLSAYDTQRVLDNIVDLQGFTSSLVLNFMLMRNLILNVGASYHSQDEKTDLPEAGLSGWNDLDRNRFYVSLRFALPEFWRF